MCIRDSYKGEQCVSYIMLQADELTVPSVLEALKAGRFYASQGPVIYEMEATDDALIVRHSPATKCTFCSNVYWVDNRCRVDSTETETIYHFKRDRTYRCV